LNEPQITVVIPIFNGAATIKRAVDSVVAQSHSNLEIIIVDDGSTDGADGLIEQWSIERLTVIKHAQNRGAAAARNTGIAAARGNWVAFLDADDCWHPSKIERQVDALGAHGNSSFRACATGFVLHKQGRTRTVRVDLSPSQFRRDIRFGCTISPGSTLMVERRAFDEIGPFDETLRRLEDWDWLLRFSQHPGYDMKILSEPLADIFEHPLRKHARRDSLDPVMQSIERIGAKHLTSFHGVARRQLQSSLLVEKASRMDRARRPFSASVYVLAALAIYPRRNAAFFRSLWRAVKRLFE
jgi:glycosyltransferase involved in cell wall biosynthesis